MHFFKACQEHYTNVNVIDFEALDMLKMGEQHILQDVCTGNVKALLLLLVSTAR